MKTQTHSFFLYLACSLRALATVGCGNSHAGTVGDGGKAAADAAITDSAVPPSLEASIPDSPTADEPTPDAFTPDASTPDAFTPDAATPDAAAADNWTPQDAPAGDNWILQDASTSSDNGLLTLGGTFHGLSFTPVDGFAAFQQSIDPALADAGVNSELTVLVADKPGLCTTGVLRQSGTFFAFDALSGDSTLVPATFTEMQPQGPGQVDVEVVRFDDACALQTEYVSASGSVTVTEVTSTDVAGTFDVTMSLDAGTLYGSFRVPLCSTPSGNTCDP